MRPCSPLRPRVGAVAIGTLIAASLGATAPPALASPGPQYGTIGQYGEVWRGGGFDKSGYNNGQYGGPLTPGKFIDPVGFAVDTHDTTPGGDGTAVYVLDRTSNLPGNVTGAVTTWRLQKLSDTGVVLGTSQFSLPANSATNTNSYQMLGLAVDPAVAGHTTGGRVYALIEAYDVNVGIEYADEIVAWSTTPTGTQLVAPTGMPADKLSKGIGGTPPGLLSSSSQLISGGNESIQNPQGLALDISGTTDYVAVQDNDLTAQSAGGSGITRVSPTTGAITQQWSSSVLSADPNDNGDESYPPAGISTAANGSLTVLLNTGLGLQAPANIDVVEVPADLTSAPLILASGINAPFGGFVATDNDPVVTGSLSPESGDPDGSTAGTNLAGPQVVGLSNGLYAAEFEPDPVGVIDPQTPSQVPGLWTQANPAARLLVPESDGTLSNQQPPLTSLFDTLGNPTINQTGMSQAASACNLSDPLTASPSGLASPSFAAGAAGSLWVLTRGVDSTAIPFTGPPGEGGRELIELAPGAGFPCPVPSGTFTVADQNGAAQPASTSTPLFVGAGDTVNFDATPIQYFGAATQAYEWDFGDGTPTNPDTTTVSTDTTTGNYFWPPPTVSHQYTQTGTYTVTLKLFGDFGEYDESGAIQVGVNTPPIGTFTFAPDGQQAGSPVSFDATGSTPSPSASIIDFHWDWGDGTFDDTPAATDSHAYAAPGTYTTTLTVLDSRYGHGAPVSQTVTVVTPAPPPAPSTTPTTNTPPPPPPPPAPAVSASIASTASTAGLVRAVVYCHAGRASCSGTVELKTRPAVAARKKQKSTVVVLGRASFRVRGGKHETVYIHLSAKARALLRRSRTLPVAATITVQGASGPPITTLQPRTLRFATARVKPKRK